MFAPVRTVAPAALVTTDEAKTHLRVDDSDQDALIDSLVAAATAHLDGWSGILGRALVTQSWRQDFGCFHDCMRLPLAPVISITSITYYDANNAQQTLGAGVYSLFTDVQGPYVARLQSQTWPNLYDRADPISITFVAGYGAPSDVPAPLKAAVLLLVGHWYENREAVSVGNPVAEMPLAVDRLISPYRRIGI